MFGEVFKRGAVHTLTHLGYFSGLSTLVPVIAGALRLNKAPWDILPPLFWIALGVVVICVIALWVMKRSLSALFISIGMMTMIPGFLAFLFGIISQETIFNAISAKVTAFAVVAPAIGFFIEHSVPTAIYIAVIYIVVGYLLWKIGMKLQRGI